MKKFISLLLILIFSVTTVFASTNTLYETNKVSPEKFYTLANLYDCDIADSVATFITATKLVKSVGFNNNGQLGIAGLDKSAEPVDLPLLRNVIKVVSGIDFSVAVTMTGKVYVWGKNDRGQLGLGDKENRIMPVELSSISSVMDIAAGDDFVIAVCYDGSVWSWGANDYGQLGFGDKTDRIVPEKIPGFVTTAAVYAGNSHVAAFTGAAKIYVWGKNDVGQLGLGHTNEQTVPVYNPNFSSGTDYALGDDFTAVLKGAGTVYVCGKNDAGQLGLGHNNDTVELTQIPDLRQISAIDAGRKHMGAINYSGILYTWGNNDFGQLGTGDTTSSNVPVRSTLSSVKTDIKCGGYATAILTGGGPVYFAGNLVSGDGQVINPQPAPTPSRPQKPDSIKDIGILINNEWFTTDVEPIIINDRVLLPMRAIFEKYGAKLDWNDSSKTATAVLNDTTISVAIGATTAYVNDKAVTLDSPATIVNSRTLVPVRFISENLGFKVDWDGNERVVIITK